MKTGVKNLTEDIKNIIKTFLNYVTERNKNKAKAGLKIVIE